mmetsp:Transcript_13580/g.39798  ORF Transcript_13580/g.39798 Transcript_13580/m.39798 type:complete len:258 (-) Transcript_13580:63-836(-)
MRANTWAPPERKPPPFSSPSADASPSACLLPPPFPPPLASSLSARTAISFFSIWEVSRSSFLRYALVASSTRSTVAASSPKAANSDPNCRASDWRARSRLAEAGDTDAFRSEYSKEVSFSLSFSIWRYSLGSPPTPRALARGGGSIGASSDPSEEARAPAETTAIAAAPSTPAGTPHEMTVLARYKPSSWTSPLLSQAASGAAASKDAASSARASSAGGSAAAAAAAAESIGRLGRLGCAGSRKALERLTSVSSASG